MSQLAEPAYCLSRFRTRRLPTREVQIGKLRLGGKQPIRIQSMTTTDTLDEEATSRQAIALAEAGCEIVRITAPSQGAARALAGIAKRVRQAGVEVPLVADIHFLPSAAMEAVEHVEKVRVNPGNYADKKRFKVHEYTDAEYAEELERLHEAFSPLVLRAKELGRCLRIGTNHGSLSDRIMNRYGDTPDGMVESALEFIRIAESHGFHELVVSMKASNPKVMVEAYRLAAARMQETGLAYPLHLGVTEAGDGEDARVKSAIGIGSLLNDGIGDTIRVSLTEDPIHEVPVARELVHLAETAQSKTCETFDEPACEEQINPYRFERRLCHSLTLGSHLHTGSSEVPKVVLRASAESAVALLAKEPDTPVEGLLLTPDTFAKVAKLPQRVVPFLEIGPGADIPALPPRSVLVAAFSESSAEALADLLRLVVERDLVLAAGLPSPLPPALLEALRTAESARWIAWSAGSTEAVHATGRLRLLAADLRATELRPPLWLRYQPEDGFLPKEGLHTLEASMLCGSLLCDGLGDLLSVETGRESEDLALAYRILQGARARVSRTEYVACPSCGRTLFDLQSTTQKIRARTDHLKGVTIAIMGCIVNGPGEMADADFGYVGGGPGKVNLYVGKTCVKKNIPESEAVQRLIDLIDEHGKWVDPPQIAPHNGT